MRPLSEGDGMTAAQGRSAAKPWDSVIAQRPDGKWNVSAYGKVIAVALSTEAEAEAFLDGYLQGPGGQR